ncbi:MAG: hypothetical protein OXK77_11425 [Gemmatimonadota bacterium]|nr:hypothetical protein [Gemmatimonadota bacterium]MDE2865853.1 hypothetical protein [Gemmatimonadota bacterium]
MTTHKACIRRLSLLAAIGLLGLGCTPRTYPIKKLGFLNPHRATVSPFGTEASITVRGDGRDRTVTGELIEVRDDGFLILSDESSMITLVPYSRMAKLNFQDDVGANTSVDSRLAPGFKRIPPLPEDEVRQRAIARFSRYPFGLDDAQLRGLLETLGQSALVVIGS